MNRRHRHRAPRGFSLIEIMVVLVILGLVTGGIAVAAFKYFNDARLRDTRIQATALRQQAQVWRSLEGHDGCPTPEQLVKDGLLDESARLRDAWDRPFSVECDGERTLVRSAGPDKQKGTEDDIVIPHLTKVAAVVD